MKRNLVSRIVTAVTIVGIAAAVTACGSGSGSGNGIGGPGGYSALSGSGQIPLSPAIAFNGPAYIGPDGGIIAGPQTQLTMQSIPGSAPAANGPLQPCSLGGSFMAGRCGAWANLGISVSGNTYAGSQAQISGLLTFNSVAWGYLTAILGQSSSYGGGYAAPFPLAQSGPSAYGYSGAYGSYGATSGAITTVAISDSPIGNGQLGLGVASGTLATQDGMQLGGAAYALYSGYVVLVVSGQSQPISIPF